jgi:hypothetical protein
MAKTDVLGYLMCPGRVICAACGHSGLGTPIEDGSNWSGDAPECQRCDRPIGRVEAATIADMLHTEDHDWSRSVCSGCSQDYTVLRAID